MWDIGGSISTGVCLIGKNALNRRVVGIFKRRIQRILDDMGLIGKHLGTLNTAVVEISKDRTHRILCDSDRYTPRDVNLDEKCC